MACKHLAALLVGLCLCSLTVQTSPFYSLQPAVEALSEREAQLALRNEIENGNIDDFDNDFEWNNDYDNSEREQRLQVPSRALASYLARSNLDYDDIYPAEYRKRSMYRKRGASVFRERSRTPNVQRQQQQALAEKFLKAIEGEREKEEEEEYRQQLRNLWNRYQTEEGNMEKELFDNGFESDYPLNNDIDRKRNRQNGDVEVAPSYWNDKRSMPLLPWLPASRKKRFPVTKRSPKVNTEMLVTPSDANKKVSQDLQGIFGAKETAKNGVESMKKKRSSDETRPMFMAENPKKVESSLAMMHEHHKTPPHSAQKKQKRNASDPDDDEEADNENVDEDVDEGDDSSEDESKKKKKREASKSLETVQEESAPETKINMKRKSFQWSNIFGIDRKKKSSGLIFHPLENVDRRKKQCVAGECDGEDYDEGDYEDDDYRRKKRSREEKLEAMDHKLKTIENLIIEDTAKYYENHDGSLSPSEARTLRNRVADRLATAYSLEKMRKAIARLKQSMAFEKNLERNLLETVPLNLNDDDEKKKAKRVAVKKEKAEFDNNDHDVDSPAKKASMDPKQNDLSVDEDKKKKKRSQKKSDISNFIGEASPMSEGYMGGRIANECPVLDGIEKKCRGIDIMSGDSHQNLLEACGAHQLCYLCGDSQLQCDYEYLNDAEEVCGRDLKCKIAAREALSVLRSIGGNRIPQRECIRNPCLNMALADITY